MNQTILAAAKIETIESELKTSVRRRLCAHTQLAIKAAQLARHVFAFLCYIIEL